MNSTTTVRESNRRTAWAGLWLLGALALSGLTAIEQPLVGVGVYTTSALAAIVVWMRYPGTLFDERDASIHREASGYTIQLLAIVSQSSSRF